MDTQAYRDKLTKWDQESREERVLRWQQIKPASYGSLLPDLLWEYIVEAVNMYIRGHPTGTVLLCAAAIEIILADQIKAKSANTISKIRRGRELGLLEEDEATRIDELRKLRNELIHAHAGQLKKRAMKLLPAEWASPSLYFLAGLPGSIDADALKCLQTARDLAVKFYGEKEQ